MEVKERPILMSAWSVQAILDGRKSATRRVIKPQPPSEFAELDADNSGVFFYKSSWEDENEDVATFRRCPYGQPGDRLWVREAWNAFDEDDTGLLWTDVGRGDREAMIWDTVVYKASPEKWRNIRRWVPSIHMPRWASRITLEVTGVRVERVQDISEEDAKAEGIKVAGVGTLERYPRREAFRSLWDSINARRGYGWDANPFVWVVEYKRVKNV